MELIIASKTKLHQQGNVNSTIAIQSVIRAMLLECQSEVFSLKKKATAIIRFMDLGYLSEKCLAHKKAQFKKELFQFVEEAFPHFQNRIEKQLGKWSAIMISKESSFETELEKIQAMHQEWQELKQKFWQLEMQIMEGLFQNYPVRIF